jgi:hypothetical protein
MYLDQLETKTNAQKWFKELAETYCVEKVKGKKQVVIEPWSYGWLQVKSNPKIIKVKNTYFLFEYYFSNKLFGRDCKDDYIQISVVTLSGTLVYSLYNDSDFERLKKILKLHIKLAKGMEEYENIKERRKIKC